MASKGSEWREAEREYRALGWDTAVFRGKKQAWQAPCGAYIWCASTPKDARAGLNMHLQVVRRHQRSCPTC